MAAWRKKKDEEPSLEELQNIPQGIDASTFFAPIIPSEVRAVVPLLHTLVDDAQAFRQALDAALLIVREGQVDPQIITILRGTAGLETIDLGILLSGLYTILRQVIRNRIRASIVEKDLLEMHLPPPFVEEIIRLIKANRGTLEQAVIPQRMTFPSLLKLKWRVDVTISSSAISRVLKPTILMQAFLSDGQIKTFEVPIPQFHQLRYKVAKLLHNMQELERHPIIRLIRTLEAEKKLDT